MAEAVKYTKAGKASGKTDLDPALFGHKVNDHLLYEYINAYMANQRLGTAKAKGRSEVSGGTSKPWRQKGTGRSRAGSNTSPIWVRGGKAFGPTPRDYTVKLPKKKKRKAMLYALSVKAGEDGIKVIEDLKVNNPKTKDMADIVKTMALNAHKNLFVVENYDRNLFLSTRNLKHAEIKRLRNLNPYDVLNAGNLIFTESSLTRLKETLLAKEDK
jgi:large subunit ribosomal protein L4